MSICYRLINLSSSKKVVDMSFGHSPRRQEGDQNIEAEDLTPRPYQEELYELCKTRNTIICLDTGSGKTFIAVMLIRHLSHKCHSEGKKIFFVVPSIPLVSQQSAVIQTHTDLRVGKYSGCSYDDWTKEQWIEELGKYDVIVIIHEILRRILYQGFVSLSQLSLLVMDECHHSIKNHPYREIMRKFEDCPLEKQPRILGLSASLISNYAQPVQIEGYIRELEKTMRSVCETPTDLGSIHKFAAKPSEEVIEFDSFDVLAFDNINFIYLVSESLLEFLKEVSLLSNTIKGLGKIIKDILYILTTMGVWCAKQVIRIYIRQLSDTVEMLSSTKSHYTGIVLMTLHVIKAQLKDLLKGLTPHQKLLKYSSPKLQKLVELLKAYNAGESLSTSISNLCGIIFVERRSVARVLCRWLQELAKQETNQLPHLKVDYVLGAGGSTLTGTSVKKQEESLKKFRSHECNLLVATSVLEEGLDVSICNLVVRYDWPKTFREYIQSKGRARAQRGKYILFIERNLFYFKTKQKLEQFRKTEDILHRICHKRTAPTESETEDSFNDEEVKPYVANDSESSGRASLNSSISIIDRYCRKLPSDSFTKPSPHYKIEGCGSLLSPRYVCTLRLPINCQIRHEIKSNRRKKKMTAKKEAALKACEILHKNKELDDNFLPVAKLAINYIKELGLESSPDEMEEVCEGPRPGTKKRRQFYAKLVADVHRNPIEPNIKCFLYEFVMKLSKPIPEEQNTRGRKITDPAHTTKNFGVLTTQRVPPICEFPVFTRSGEVSVNLELVREDVRLTNEQIKDLSIFHKFTFSEVLGLIKYPLEFDPQKSNSKHFVVPIDCSEFGDKDIDWYFVKQIKRHTDSAPNSDSREIRKNFTFRANLYTDAVVIPWYRKENAKFFYVAEICHNLSPKSPFPNDGYETFEEYYSEKYEIEIMNTNQPLLNVDHTPAPINLLTPRYVSRSGVPLPSTTKSKIEKRENQQEKQKLVPELCYVHPFPASFWRKAVCLPCLLFRLNSLLVAEQLRYKVAVESGIGLTNLKPGMSWTPLDFGSIVLQEEGITDEMTQNQLALSNKSQEPARKGSYSGEHTTEVPKRFGTKIEDIVGQHSFHVSTDMEDISSDEDQDNGIARRGNGISVNKSRDRNEIYCELVKHFVHLLTDENDVFNQFSSELSDEETDDHSEQPIKPLWGKMNQNVNFNQGFREGVVGFGELLSNREQSESKPFIENFDPLKSDADSEGPSPAMVLQALTLPNASDGINLERLETVGDSFLKYAVSAFLYCVCPDIHEGELSSLRSMQISNMNLYRLGKRIGVGQFINATKFEPKENWCPPCFETPDGLEKALIESKSDKSLTVYNIGGIEDLKHLNADQIRDKIKDLSNEDLNCEKLSQKPISLTIPFNLRTYHLISDKSIADCVEALIGAHLISSGPRGALLFMKWIGLKVMPTPEMTKIKSPNNYDIYNPIWHWLPAPKSPLLSPNDLNGLYDGSMRNFEKQLGYKFLNKAYLVQAFTHISFYENQVTDCYQRLEFLGDAVLDYLITRYLYEDPAAHSPGILTDLRSALVNNKFFASLSVKYKFYKHLKYFCLDLFGVIEAFVKTVDQNSDRTEYLDLLIGENEMENPEDIEVPKALGDIFESVAGAIFLDSGMSLDAVWKVYYKMMKPKIEYFSSHVPKSPIRELLEMEPQNTTFGKPEVISHRKVCVSVKVFGLGDFKGFGRNQRTAKCTAAKRALRALKSR